MRHLSRRGILTFCGAAAASAAVGHRSAAQIAPAQPPSPETPSPLEVFSRTPLVDNIAILPNGGRIAAVTEKGDDKFLLYFDLPKGAPQHVNLGAVKIRDLFWGDNDHIIVGRSTATDIFDMDVHEYFSAYSIDTKTQKVQQLFDHERYPDIEGGLSRVKKGGQYRLTAGRYKGSNSSVFRLYSPPTKGRTTGKRSSPPASP